MNDSVLFLLGWNVLISGVLALIVAAVGLTLWIRRRPALLHALWLLVLVKLVTPPLIPLPIVDSTPAPRAIVSDTEPAAPDRPAIEMRQAATRFDRATAIDTPADFRVPERSLEDRATLTQPRILEGTEFPGDTRDSAGLLTLPGLLVGLWGTVSLLLLGRNWFRVRRTSRLLRRAGPSDDRLTRIALDAATRMNVGDVGVRIVDARVPPMVWTGWKETRILFPRQLVDQLSDEQITCIACHELAHYLRRDQWFNTFGLFVSCLFWWHPATWFACREMRRAQELCCDELVIRRCAVSRQSYLKTLFQALEFIQVEQVRLPALASGFGDGRSITSRFRILAGGRVVHRNSLASNVMVFAMLTGLSCVPTPSEPGNMSGADGSTAEALMSNAVRGDVVTTNEAARAESDDDVERLYLHWFTPTYDRGEGNPPLHILTLTVTPSQGFDAVSFDPLHERRECSIQGRVEIYDGTYVGEIDASWRNSGEIFRGAFAIDQPIDPVGWGNAGVRWPTRLVLSRERSVASFLERQAAEDTGSGGAVAAPDIPGIRVSREEPDVGASGTTEADALADVESDESVEETGLYLHWFTPTYYAGEGNPPLHLLTLSVAPSVEIDTVSFDPLLDRRECTIKGRIDLRDSEYVGDFDATWRSSGEQFEGEFELEVPKDPEAMGFASLYSPTRLVLSRRRSPASFLERQAAEDADNAAVAAPASTDVQVVARDDFDGALQLDWQIIRPDDSQTSLTEKEGFLTIVTQRGSILGDDGSEDERAKNIYLIENPLSRSMDFTVTTCLDSFAPTEQLQQAGLLIYDDDDNYLKWVLAFNQTDQRAFDVIREIGGGPMWTGANLDVSEASRVWLRVEKRDNEYTVMTSADGTEFHPHVSTVWGDGGPGFIGLFATNGGEPDAGQLPARFDFFELQSGVKPADWAAEDSSSDSGE